MRYIELVAFENDSILHQKALSLPIGKVSLRQLGVLVVGILSVFAAYAITDNFWVSAILFAVFLGIGMPNTKIMTPDQMIKNTIMFWIRGTSLSKKPEYMQKNNSKNKSKQKQQERNTRSDKNTHHTQRPETQTNDNIMSKIMSQLESLYKKKSAEDSSIPKQESDHATIIDKNYSIKVELTPENMLNITPLNKKKKQNNNSIDKLLNSLITSKRDSPRQTQSNFLQEHVAVLINDKKLESDRIILSSKDNSMSALLDKYSNYNISTMTDEEIESNKLQ